MRIGIDARFYGPTGKGLGRYVQEVVDNIIKISEVEIIAQHEYVVFLSPDNFDEFNSSCARIKKVKLPCRWYSWQEQLLMPFYLARARLDLIHFPHFNVPLFVFTPFVVTIHDLILAHFPTLRSTTHSRFVYYLKYLAYRLVIWSALRRARLVIAVSKFTKDDIIKEFKLKPEKIVVTYEGVAVLSKGVDSLFVAKLNSSEVLAQYRIPKEYLLYVGNAYPHKNLEIFIRAFGRLRAERPLVYLVLVGKIDYFYERLRKLAIDQGLLYLNNENSPIIFAGYVPDAQLEIFYREARAYVFPSLYEGFGLPPLEALSKSCPVVSSDRASLPEILGEAALYFNPEQEADILEKMRIILDDQTLRNRLIAAGRERVKLYSWWECAWQTILAYNSALKNNQ